MITGGLILVERSWDQKHGMEARICRNEVKCLKPTMVKNQSEQHSFQITLNARGTTEERMHVMTARHRSSSSLRVTRAATETTNATKKSLRHAAHVGAAGAEQNRRNTVAPKIGPAMSPTGHQPPPHTHTNMGDRASLPHPLLWSWFEASCTICSVSTWLA